jgi:hypothetical protein
LQEQAGPAVTACQAQLSITSAAAVKVGSGSYNTTLSTTSQHIEQNCAVTTAAAATAKLRTRGIIQNHEKKVSSNAATPHWTRHDRMHSRTATSLHSHRNNNLITMENMEIASFKYIISDTA